MSDYVAYYESSAGHYMPIIVKDKGGDKVYRDMTRDDIRGIEDSYMNGGDSEAPGGWLYKKGQGARASWSKRYMLLKGQYLFYFHGPQNDRPVGVIPIENCEIILPPDNGKSFSGNRFFRANDGFEFEISHLERRPFQLYAATDHDRSLWLQRLNARTGRMYGGVGKDSHILIRERTASITGAKSSGDGVSNVAITNTKVFARDLNSNVDDSSMDESRLFAGKSVADPFAPPLPPAQMSGKSGTSIDSGGDGEVSAAALAAISQRTLQHNKPLAFNSPSLVPSLKKTDMHMHSSGAGDVASVSSSSKLESALAYSLEKDDDVKRIALEERSNLEKDLQEKFRLQQEGRKREAQARERNMSKQRLEAARVLEMRNPMTLAELFRCLMFFVDEDLCEEPARDTPLQFPHLKGEWTENMMVSVYQRYCRTTGFMSLEEFVEFMEDFAVLQTHCPHDDNDEPMPEYLAQLDPVRLLTTIPRNLGYSRDMEANLRSGAQDDFNLNFAQFYQLLLRITHICYSEIYEVNPVAAFNKILQESVLPLYAWAQGHSKRGSSDPLVTEERIALLMVTYAPNLWKVFLMYCQNYQAKIPDMAMLYPEASKTSEQILFGYPFNAQLFLRKAANLSNPSGARGVGGIRSTVATEEEKDKQNAAYFITEAGCVRFALDYGIIPHLISKKEVKDLFRELNRSKMLYIVKPSTQPQPPTVFFQKTQTTLRREHGAFTNVDKSDTEHPMYFGFSDKMKSPGASPTKKSAVLKTTTNSGSNGRLKVSGRAGVVAAIENGESSSKLSGGLGFSEFIEFIAKIAVVGMDNPNYHVLFPTPFSKVLAMLMVWGIADVKKLDEVRAIRSETLEA